MTFEVFEPACRAWIDRLGLHDWAVTIERTWRLTQADEQTRARTYMNWTQRAARVVWNENYRQPTDYVIAQTAEQYALHEVLHIATNTLVQVAVERRDVDAPEVDAEEHALIRRLMRALETANASLSGPERPAEEHR